MLAKRHRGAFNLENPGPYELSRSRIEAFFEMQSVFLASTKNEAKEPS